MKLKNGIIIQKIDDEYILIDSCIEEPNFNGMIKLNETSKVIIELLKEKDVTEEDIVNHLKTMYEGDEEIIKSSVNSFIKKLSKTPILKK